MFSPDAGSQNVSGVRNDHPTVVRFDVEAENVSRQLCVGGQNVGSNLQNRAGSNPPAFVTRSITTFSETFRKMIWKAEKFGIKVMDVQRLMRPRLTLVDGMP